MEERDYGIEGTPSKYGTPREISDLDEDDVSDDQYAAEQTTYEDASSGDVEQPRNAAQISREILNSIFRAIGDAMRHHRTVFNHDLETTHSAFSAFDRDGSGEINLPEFEAAMRRLDIPLSDEQLRQIFETFDTNDNGTIEYTEFAQELHRHGQAEDEEEADCAGEQQQEDDEEALTQYSDDTEGEEAAEVIGTGKITYQIDDDSDDEEEQEEIDESFGNLTMGVIVEEPMEEIEEITPSPRPSPNSERPAADDANATDSSVLRDTEADLQHFVEEWRTLDTQQTNALSLKELAILLQRLPVPMGVGEQGGAEELGELMTQLLASQEVPVVNGAVGFREVGLWMVKQLTVFSQQQEEAEARDLNDDSEEEDAETDDQYDDDGYEMGPSGEPEPPAGQTQHGHVEGSRPSPRQSPPPSPVISPHSFPVHWELDLSC